MLLGPGSSAGIRDSVTQEREGLVPFPADFAPLPATAETGLACPVKWEFPSSQLILESRATKFRVLAFAEAGDTITVDHLLQMATLVAEHKPIVLGIPGHVPMERTIAVLQSLHALFQLLTTEKSVELGGSKTAS